MTEGNKNKHLTAPKLWYLKVEKELFVIIILKEQGQQDGIEPSMNLCTIITIKDNKRRHKIYDEISQYLNEYQFIHSNIKINEEIRIINKN